MCESAIVVIAKLAKNRSSENSKARKDARLDLCRLPRFLLNGWRLDDMELWPFGGAHSRRRERNCRQSARNAEWSRRDARRGRRSFSEVLQGVLQVELSAVCPHALLSKCNACIFRRRSDANLRTANRSSQLDVAREERRGRCSFLQKRQ